MLRLLQSCFRASLSIYVQYWWCGCFCWHINFWNGKGLPVHSLKIRKCLTKKVRILQHIPGGYCLPGGWFILPITCDHQRSGKSFLWHITVARWYPASVVIVPSNMKIRNICEINAYTSQLYFSGYLGVRNPHNTQQPCIYRNWHWSLLFEESGSTGPSIRPHSSTATKYQKSHLKASQFNTTKSCPSKPNRVGEFKPSEEKTKCWSKLKHVFPIFFGG